ncbi:MAG: hypothetical protein ACRDT6_08395 [Micromonosporaceae bacterium]
MRNQRVHRYEVRPSIGGPPLLAVSVDRQAGTLTATAADRPSVTLDVATARALWIVINEAVYQERSLRPDGSMLTLTCDRGTGRAVTVGRNR